MGRNSNRPWIKVRPINFGARWRWLGPLALVGIIAIFHFIISPDRMFWHDLLRRLFYLPILWAVYLGGFRGGILVSIIVVMIFSLHLLLGWRGTLSNQWDQIYDIAGYLAVGGGVGLIVDRIRHTAVAAIRREWEISLRSVINAAVHELKKPRSEIGRLAQDLIDQSSTDGWEYSVGVRLRSTSCKLAEIRQDLSGIAKILASRSPSIKPIDWALRFVANSHFGGGFGLIVVVADPDHPPPRHWPIPPAVLDEVTRCLLEDCSLHCGTTLSGRLILGGVDDSLSIEYAQLADVATLGETQSYAPRLNGQGLIRHRLLDLTRGHLNGVVEKIDADDRFGFRLILRRPRLRLSGLASNRLRNS